MNAATPHFDLGHVVATRGILLHVGDNESWKQELARCLARHHRGDCGDMCEEDVLTNLRAILQGARVFSSYITLFGKIWIITEADRSSTTILFPSEY